MPDSLAERARALWEVPRDLLLGRYPPFVTGSPLPRGHVPVFVFHTLEPNSFESKLRYLADNAYQTLSAAEYREVLAERRPPPERAVVLTFDDGRASLFTVGLPLLRRYGMKAIAFLVPGRMNSGAPRPMWDDVPAAGASLSVVDEDGGTRPFVSWEEVELLSSSGLFDLESHTLLHARVHTSPRVVGFMTPRLREGYAAMDVPLVAEGGIDLLAPDVPLGTPLLASQPRTAEVVRFFEDPAIRRACVSKVEREGEAFFTRKGWEQTLWGILKGRPIDGRRESEEERRAALLREIRESKSLIEERLGKPVAHLCYPWHAGGATCRQLAEQTGYRAAFGGKVPGVPITLPGGDLWPVARISEDFVLLLPGKGRATLRGVLARKWARRAEGRRSKLRATGRTQTPEGGDGERFGA